MSQTMRFEYSVTKTSDTGLQVLRLVDNVTGIVVNTVIPNSEFPTASVASYVAARYSRSNKSVVELLTELVTKGTNAVAKMGEIFNTYGHASVADMAGVFCFIENIPSIYATRIFMESSVGAGMERSTRYQDFGKIEVQDMPDLASFLVDSSQLKYSLANDVFIDAQVLMQSKYKKWQSKLTTSFANHYSVDNLNKKDNDALKARVYDTARSFLPWGGFNKTSMGYLTSAREWSRLIGLFKGSKDELLKNVGLMLEMLLAPSEYTKTNLDFLPEVDELIRYTQAEGTMTKNLETLKWWLVKNAKQLNDSLAEKNQFKNLRVQLIPTKKGSHKTLEGYIAVLYPLLSYSEIQQYVESLSEKQLNELSVILFQDHTQHKQMPIMARNGDYGFVLQCTFAEMRDLNRHRAFGRYCPLVLTDANLPEMSQYNNWILPPYLDHMPMELKHEFLTDILECNAMLQKFEQVSTGLKMCDQLYKHLWMFCQVTPYHMFGSTKDVHYITHLRVRPGGHISYRMLSQMMADAVALDDPLMSAIFNNANSDVDPNCRKQFLDRS
jgi:thymidylate synthase ThyX